MSRLGWEVQLPPWLRPRCQQRPVVYCLPTLELPGSAFRWVGSVPARDVNWSEGSFSCHEVRGEENRHRVQRAMAAEQVSMGLCKQKAETYWRGKWFGRLLSLRYWSRLLRGRRTGGQDRRWLIAFHSNRADFTRRPRWWRVGRSIGRCRGPAGRV